MAQLGNVSLWVWICQLDAAEIQPYCAHVLRLMDPDCKHYSDKVCVEAFRQLAKRPVHVLQNIPGLRERLKWAVGAKTPFKGCYSDCYMKASELLVTLRAQ